MNAPVDGKEHARRTLVLDGGSVRWHGPRARLGDGEARLHENVSARYALMNRERAFGVSIGVSRLGGSAAGLH